MKTSLFFLFLIVLSCYLSQQTCSEVGPHGYIDNSLTQQIEIDNIWFELEEAQFGEVNYMIFRTAESNKEALERLATRLERNGVEVIRCNSMCLYIREVPLDSILLILSKK